MKIGGVQVRCIPPHTLVAYHSGYPLDRNDCHDFRLLCEKSNLTMP